MSWTPPKLVKWISDDLEKRGLPAPHRFQAEQLVSHALNISRLDIYLQHDKPSTPEEQSILRDLVKRKYRREPIAYITGSCDFWSLQMKVGPGVLIPRPDTEVLVETALEIIPADNHSVSRSILELGTGTAAIPLALCSERSHLEIVAIDCSWNALTYARANIEAHPHLIEQRQNSILLVQSNRFNALKPNAMVDFIISNPPYIPDNHLPTLQNEVKDWEPAIALAGGKSGTDFYHDLLHAAENHLKPSGYLLFEHGYDQAKSIMEIMKTESCLTCIESRKDYAGNDRVLLYQKR